MSINKSYEDINDILKRVSNRTLEIKTNNVKLLNKIGYEMNNLLVKVQEIVRFCINDRNDFMKEIELIQFDFIQLGRKIDQHFSAQTQMDSSKLSQTNELSQKHNKTNLQKLLNNDSEPCSDEETSDTPSNKIINNFDLVIPDTCIPIDSNFQRLNNNKNFFIRDTIDCNNEEIYQQNNNKQTSLETINENTSVINDSLEKEDNINTSINKNLDETCLEEEHEHNELNMKNKLEKNNLNYLRNSQSTPLAVKKKLQEHGLLDLTNSPHKSPSIFNTNSTTNNLNKKNQFASPVKYIQSKFQLESPNAPSTSKIKTPVKLVLKTPTKSPSLVTKKPNFMTNENELNNENDSINKQSDLNNESLDFSFEFKKNSKPKKSDSTMHLNQSPKKVNIKLSNTPQAKRFKQLTMSQALCSNSAQSSSKMVKKISNFDETCLPDQEAFASDKLTRIKNEPVSFKHIVESNNQNQIKNIKIKNEPFEEERLYYTEDLEKNNETHDTEEFQKQRNLANDYFNDFDKVPKKKKSDSPTFKHVQVVRKQDERKKLPTSSCRECENYWNSLPEEMRPKRMDESCKHRSKYQAPPTPEHYWSIGFPTTQECIQRGYGGVLAQNDKEDQIGKRPRRKRPLQLVVNDDKNKGDDCNADLDFGE